MKSDYRINIEMPVVVSYSSRFQSLAIIVIYRSGLCDEDGCARNWHSVVEQHAGYCRHPRVFMRSWIAGEQANARQTSGRYA
jgi:hypothetical protein